MAENGWYVSTAGIRTSVLEHHLNDLFEHCTECGACMKACRFLSHYGTPKAIMDRFDFTLPDHQKIAYACSLCGLCTAVCPEKLDPCGIFLEIRRRFVENGHFQESDYRTILGYERRGHASMFSWYGLSKGCDTVFFPGCTLPGTRPKVTMEIFRDLQKIIPALGMVLDCCAKPSHDLGRQSHFNDVFHKMTDNLIRHGVKQVLVACPNCYNIFRQYGNALSVRTVYEILHENGFKTECLDSDKTVSVHDPCPLRFEIAVHQAIRGLLSDLGMTIVEMKHRGRRTLCCGEGGMVGFVKPDFARNWADLRQREAGGRTLVTYCAGCTHFLGRMMPTIHIVDLLYRPEAALTGSLKVSRSPLTYLNRLLLKKRMKTVLQADQIQ